MHLVELKILSHNQKWFYHWTACCCEGRKTKNVKMLNGWKKIVTLCHCFWHKMSRWSFVRIKIVKKVRTRSMWKWLWIFIVPQLKRAIFIFEEMKVDLNDERRSVEWLYFVNCLSFSLYCCLTLFYMVNRSYLVNNFQ